MEKSQVTDVWSRITWDHCTLQGLHDPIIRLKSFIIFGPCQFFKVSMLDGAFNFFSGRYVRPRFPNFGACEQVNCCESGGGDYEQIFINKGAWEVVFYKICKLFDNYHSQNCNSWAVNCFIFGKLLIFKATISFKWGSCEWTCASTEVLVNSRRGNDRGSWGPHTNSFSGECPLYWSIWSIVVTNYM